MAASGKSSNGWGSFLSQAVAGMETRLDNMLTEAEKAQQLQPDKQSQSDKQSSQHQTQAPMSATVASSPAKASPAAAASGRASPATPRTSQSNIRPSTNDRLQARLAKAMAAKTAQSTAAGGGTGTGSIAASPRSSIDTLPSRNSVDRQSLDSRADDKKQTDVVSAEVVATPDSGMTTDAARVIQDDKPDDKAVTVPPPKGEDLNGTTLKPEPASEPTPEPAPEPEPEAIPASKPLASTTPSSQPNPNTTRDETADTNPIESAEATSPAKLDNGDTSSLAKELEELKARQQEEIQEYVERIDSLQSKLQYLSKGAADSARKTAQGAPSGSADRKLAEKDEKIALLMQEGQKLSGTEHKLRMSLKKLRQQLGDQEKQAEALRADKAAALAEAETLRVRLDSDELDGRQHEESNKALAVLQKEVDALRKEGVAKDEALSKLEQSLKTKAESDAVASVEAQNKMLAAEQAKQKQLEETISELKAANESLENKSRLEGLEWTEKLQRAQERSRTIEADSKTELLTLENKLEAMRSAAEEAVSGGAGGDGPVNLIRQMETLQSQYATASSNWQGIEASLLAKVSSLEKERDDAQSRESEIRKKAREAASRCRRLEEDLQDLQPSLAMARQELETCREEINTLRASLKSTEAALSQAQAEAEKRRSSSTAKDGPGEYERQPWGDDMPAPLARSQSRPDSPLLSVSRTLSADVFGFQIPARARRTPVSGSRPDSPAEGISIGRRRSSQPPGRPSALSPALSSMQMPPYSPFEPPSESNLMSPSIAERDDDRFPSSPRQMAQDMISVSTVGAGPTVQLVEKLSAGIRRLEAEKVAAREEMARVSSQRDEARSDMVALMKEVEANKAAGARVPELEKELQGLHERYQTTLELLGEKSELVEELKADVQDVKAMYRELVERTVK